MDPDKNIGLGLPPKQQHRIFIYFPSKMFFSCIRIINPTLHLISMVTMSHAQLPRRPRKAQVRNFLREYGLSVSQAAGLMAQLIEETGCANPRMLVKAISQAGKPPQSVSFQKAVEESLLSKSHRRIRTLREIKYITNRFIRIFPELKRKKVCHITPADCRRYLASAFDSPRQRHKARAILSGVFAVAVKRDWCEENPVRKVDTPVLQEVTINTLSLEEVDRLMAAARSKEHEGCLPALSLMLYGGIRPDEVQRMTGREIDLDEGVITIQPRHSKTGGARHVTILPPLRKILERAKIAPDQKICPANWQKRWKALRQTAGWNTSSNPWRQDVLRHTYASYHAKHFRDLTALQWEMGHRSTHLLRTRYLNMQGITAKSVSCFWA